MGYLLTIVVCVVAAFLVGYSFGKDHVDPNENPNYYKKKG